MAGGAHGGGPGRSADGRWPGRNATRRAGIAPPRFLSYDGVAWPQTVQAAPSRLTRSPEIGARTTSGASKQERLTPPDSCHRVGNSAATRPRAAHSKRGAHGPDPIRCPGAGVRRAAQSPRPAWRRRRAGGRPAWQPRRRRPGHPGPVRQQDLPEQPGPVRRWLRLLRLRQRQRPLPPAGHLRLRHRGLALSGGTERRAVRGQCGLLQRDLPDRHLRRHGSGHLRGRGQLLHRPVRGQHLRQRRVRLFVDGRWRPRLRTVRLRGVLERRGLRGPPRPR